MPEQVRDKHGEPIKEGDYVYTRIRGGRREGEVDKVVTTQAEARKEGIKNPPKVSFQDQHGHNVAHNPQTLEHK